MSTLNSSDVNSSELKISSLKKISTKVYSLLKWSFTLCLWLNVSGKLLMASPDTTSTFNVYESFVQDPNHRSYHYVLEDHHHEFRRHFSLYLSIDQQLQNLILEKSFNQNEILAAESFKNSLLEKYHLQVANENLLETLANSNLIPQAQLTKELYEKIPSPFAISNEEIVLWTATQEWTLEWEKQYGQWVEQTLTPQFMINYNIPTDCADVAYAMRWIFAYINKLPMASRLGGTRQIFTNESMKAEWVKLPTDPDWSKNKKFRAALNYILINTYTHTLMKDSYPISINVDYFTAGTHHLQLAGSTGHTMLVQKVSANPLELPITMLFSSTPKVVRQLYTTTFQDSTQPILYKNGFYKMRWPQKNQSGWRLVEANKMPGYSEEQFHLIADGATDTDPYFILIYKKINPEFKAETVLQFGINELVTRLRDRIQIVEEGYRYCLDHDCSPGSVGDEDWSTPSRDHRFLEMQNTINILGELLANNESPLTKKIQEEIQKINTEQPFKILNKNYSLQHLLTIFLYQLTQSDPRLPIEQRWGLELKKGYAMNLVSQLQPLLEMRKKLVVDAEKCRGPQKCADNSDEFKKWNTYEIDKTLALQWTGAQLLCSISGKSECNELNNFLSQKIMSDGENALSIFEKIPLWSSNPNAQLIYRWGKQGNPLYASGSPSFYLQAYFTKDQQWFNFNNQLLSTHDFAAVSFPENEHIGPIHFLTNKLFTYTWHNDKLSISVYQAPNQKIADFPLLSCPQNKTRVWWTSPTEASLTILCDKTISLFSLNGELLGSQLILQYIPSYRDPRLILIETSDGVFLSDAERNAFQFNRLPFTATELLKNNFYVVRKNNGWQFRIYVKTSNQIGESIMVYLEPKLGVLINHKVKFSFAESALTENGKYWIDDRNDAFDVYRRNNENQYELLQSLNKENILSFTLADTFINLWGFNLTGIAPENKVFNLETLNPVSDVTCSKPGLNFIFHPNNYYICNDNQSSELHDQSGKLLPIETGPGVLDTFINMIGSQRWISAYHEITLPNTNAFGSTIAEWYRIGKEKLEGPFLQNYTEYYPESSDPNAEEIKEFEVAPLPLNRTQSSNLALSRLLPVPPSYVLDAIDKSSRYRNMLLVPQ